MHNNATIIIKALEDGVSVLFSPPEGEICPTPEHLEKGEVLILPNPDRHTGIRVRGRAQVYTPDNMVESESGLVIGGRGGI
jgi:hypothetical protein